MHTRICTQVCKFLEIISRWGVLPSEAWTPSQVVLLASISLHAASLPTCLPHPFLSSSPLVSVNLFVFYVSIYILYTDSFVLLLDSIYKWFHICLSLTYFQFSSVQSLSCVRLFVTPWITARQASLSITNTQNSLKLMSIESGMPSSHLILCRLLLL